MSGLATKPNKRSVTKYIDSLDNENQKADCKTLHKTMAEVTGYKATMWGNEKNPDYIIGYGTYEYSRKGSKEKYQWFNEGFAPRKSNITIYLTLDLDAETELLDQLGKHKKGKGCLYIKKLEDVNMTVLKKLMRKSKNAKYGES